MEDLTLWVIERVAKFPRDHKFTLGDRLVETCLDITTDLVEATYLSARGPHKLARLHRAARSLTRARILVRMAQRLAILSSHQREHFAARSDDIGRMLGGWTRHLQPRQPTLAALRHRTGPRGRAARGLVEQLQHEQLPRRQPQQQQPLQRQQQRGISLRQDQGVVRIAGRSRAVSSPLGIVTGVTVHGPPPRPGAFEDHPSEAEHSRFGGPPGSRAAASAGPRGSFIPRPPRPPPRRGETPTPVARAPPALACARAAHGPATPVAAP